MWRKYQIIFYSMIILILVILYLLKITNVITDYNYSGLCIFSIVLSAIITSIISVLSNYQNKK